METAISSVRRQNRTTRRSVKIIDQVANWSITIGGLMVIVAVATIMVFLIQVVIPLFTGARIETARDYRLQDIPAQIRMVNADEYRTIAIAIGADGHLAAWHLATGTPLQTTGFDLAGGQITAFARTIDRSNLAFGFADGTVRFGAVTMAPTVLPADRVPDGLSKLDDRDSTNGVSVFSRIPGNQIRRIDVAVRLDPPQKISSGGHAIVAMDYRRGGTAERPTLSFVTADAAGAVRLSRAESRTNIMTRQTRTTVDTTELPPLPPDTEIRTLLLTDKADAVFIGSAAGEVFRYDTRDFRAPRLAERRRVTDGNEGLTSLAFLIGEQSLVAGGDRGQLDIFFTLPGGGATPDGLHLVRAHVMERHTAGIESLAASQRGKMFLTEDRSGDIWLRHATSGQTLLRFRGAGPRSEIALTPRDDSVIAAGGDGHVFTWEISAPHPETTLATIFGPVWYEGYPRPGYTWQSSAGTDQFEPKLSLIPLIFGTLKATIYALLFSVPIALLAAIYTSEFIHGRVRAIVKPAMEMMASLPSVVLGFVAALILAPLVEDIVPAVLFLLVFLPLMLTGAGYAWQILPRSVALRAGGLPKLGLIFLLLVLAIPLTRALAGPFEALVFAGDIKAWLNGDAGQGTGFTAFLLFPVSVTVVSLASNRLLGRVFDAMTGGRARWVVAAAAMLRWIALLVASVALALGVAGLLTTTGTDPRHGLVGTYVQRNTLIVSFAMGFAVIPIIYTIAEDALNSVPEHLRAASLACGATQWQTATRIILPAAASGVFAAVMIGMGRAVGETMIVVMAAGNTPLLDWNIFNGLRALSANIAVELPEAVRDGTLFRMLFLAALTLFAMTFVVNTLAEVIRLRFRRRAASL